MKKYFLTALFAMLFASVSHAQHSDIEFGFADPLAATPEFEIENDVVNNEGIQVFESSFMPLGPFLTTDNPGFITPADEGLTVNAGDRVFVRVLNTADDDSPSSIGSGFVHFFDPDTGTIQSAGGSVTVTGNGGTISVFNGDTLQSGTGSLFLSAGSDGTDMSDIPGSALDEGEENVLLGAGEIHNHLNFDLDLDDPSAVGAVGLLLQFEADLASTPGTEIDVVSDPFFFIINNRLDEEVFEEDALAAFGVGGSVLVGDVNLDGIVGFDDVPLFIDRVLSMEFQAEADIDGDGEVGFDDVLPFIDLILGASEVSFSGSTKDLDTAA